MANFSGGQGEERGTPHRSVATRLPKGAARELVLKCLVTRGGEIVDMSGRATRILRDACGYPGSMGGLAEILAGLEADGRIVRSINGRRCTRIGLAEAVGAGDEADRTTTPTERVLVTHFASNPEDACELVLAADLLGLAVRLHDRVVMAADRRSSTTDWIVEVLLEAPEIDEPEETALHQRADER